MNETEVTAQYRGLGCPVCLSPTYSDKTFLYPCFHAFCFLCIIPWTGSGNDDAPGDGKCPLCKTTAEFVIHRLRYGNEEENGSEDELLTGYRKFWLNGRGEEEVDMTGEFVELEQVSAQIRFTLTTTGKRRKITEDDSDAEEEEDVRDAIVLPDHDPLTRSVPEEEPGTLKEDQNPYVSDQEYWDDESPKDPESPSRSPSPVATTSFALPSVTEIADISRRRIYTQSLQLQIPPPYLQRNLHFNSARISPFVTRDLKALLGAPALEDGLIVRHVMKAIELMLSDTKREPGKGRGTGIGGGIKGGNEKAVVSRTSDPDLVRLVSDFIGARDALTFVNEVTAFFRSGLDVKAWDRTVTYQ